MLNRANAATRSVNKENAAAVSEFEAHVQRLNEGRIWARVREEETKRTQAEEACRVLHEQFDQQTKQGALGPQPEGREGAAGACGLASAERSSRQRTRTARCARNARSSTWSRRWWLAEIEELNAENQRLRDNISELMDITEPGKGYFLRDSFTLAVDLAIVEAITIAHLSRNQVPALFLIFARFFRIKLLTHRRKVPH
eukprot:6186288-Pleurochrysis_carterae.AAC.1